MPVDLCDLPMDEGSSTLPKRRPNPTPYELGKRAAGTACQAPAQDREFLALYVAGARFGESIEPMQQWNQGRIDGFKELHPEHDAAAQTIMVEARQLQASRASAAPIRIATCRSPRYDIFLKHIDGQDFFTGSARITRSGSMQSDFPTLTECARAAHDYIREASGGRVDPTTALRWEAGYGPDAQAQPRPEPDAFAPAPGM
ncbi:MAG: hypothetical protein HKL99_14095 [Burkholderiales bacterium]|nr:hypothetical protein [Burkholderiales bacterium]